MARNSGRGGTYQGCRAAAAFGTDAVEIGNGGKKWFSRRFGTRPFRLKITDRLDILD